MQKKVLKIINWAMTAIFLLSVLALDRPCFWVPAISGIVSGIWILVIALVSSVDVDELYRCNQEREKHGKNINRIHSGRGHSTSEDSRRSNESCGVQVGMGYTSSHRLKTDSSISKARDG